MKKIFTFLLTITVCQIMYGQNGVGIGTTTPHAPLQFANDTLNRKIVLHETANDDHRFYGFGVNENILRYQTDNIFSDHVFYSAIDSTESKELMRISGWGFVGMGTLPTNTLDIHFGTPRTGDHPFNRPLYVTGDIEEWDGIEFRHSNGTQGIGFGYSTIYATGSNEDQLLQFSSRGNAPLIFKTNDLHRMNISGEGKVGIGVEPLNKLDIATGPTRTGTHPSDMAAYITANLTAAGNGFEIRHYDGSQGIGLGSNTLYAAGSNADQNLNIAAKGATGNVALKTNTQDRLVVTGSGNVGINTPSMLNRLDINGGPTTRSGTHASGLAMYVTGNFGAASNGVEFRTPDATKGIGFGYNTIYAAGTNTDQDLNLVAKGATGNISLSTNGSEKLKITGTGNFGFSVTAPANKLDVHNGTARTGIHGTGQALYVTGGAEFRSANSLTGLGITSNAISATGLSPDVDLSFASKGPGFLSFSTDGTERMKIAGNGSIGVRIANPQNALDVSDGTPRTGLHPANLPLYVTGYSGFNTVNGEQGLGISGNQISAQGSLTNVPLIFWAKGTSGDFQFYAGNSLRMKITAEGNVGIGMAFPNAPLQFGTTPQNRKIVLKESFDNDHQFFGFGYNTNILRYQTDNSSSDHVFYSAINAADSKELMRIKGNGLIGMGVGAPLNKLDISYGPIRTGTHPTGLAAYITSDLVANQNVEIRNYDASQGVGIGIGSIYATGTNSDHNLSIKAKGPNGQLSFMTGGTERMKITGNGYTGFGVSAPLSTLDVHAGTPRTGAHGSGAALYVTGWSVFRSANAEVGTAIVENQIQANGSLASVPLIISSKGPTGYIDFWAGTTGLMRISDAGNVGIGTGFPNAPLQFSNGEQNRKIVLKESINNDHQYFGFGFNANILRYQTDLPTSDHVFYSGINGTSSKELMRIKGNGKVGIGTASPNGLLQFASEAYTRKIVLYEAANNDHQFIGFGVDGDGALHYQTDGIAHDHIFYAATSATGSNQLMRIRGTGNVAIAGIIETEAVIVPTLVNGFTQFGAGFAAVSYYKDKEGIVHVCGMANVPATPVGLTIFNLPAGYRPSTSGAHVFMTIGNNVATRVDVSSNGDVIFNSGTTGWVSLDGIAFRAD